MKIDVLTIFPDMFRPVTGESMLGRAAEKGILDIRLHDIRDYTQDRHNRTDDAPFGGGGGMVMMPDPVFRCLESIGAPSSGGTGAEESSSDEPLNPESRKLIYMSPRGRILDQEMIEEFSRIDEMIILCGHYEGTDQRILDYWGAEEVSIGDYILTGGEIPAMVLIDAVARLIPGVLGNENSAMDESIYSGLLEHPQYTQPRDYRGLHVPDVLLEGNHKLIDLWRFRKSLELTADRRSDLFEEYVKAKGGLSKDERKILEEVAREHGYAPDLR